MSYIVDNIQDILILQKKLDYELSMKGGAKNILNFKTQLQKYNSYITTLFYITSLSIVLVILTILFKKTEFKMIGGRVNVQDLCNINMEDVNLDNYEEIFQEKMEECKNNIFNAGRNELLALLIENAWRIPYYIYKFLSSKGGLIFLGIIVLGILIYLFLNLLLDKKLYLPCAACDTGTDFYKCIPGTGKNSSTCRMYQDILRKLKKMIESFEYIGYVVEQLTQSIDYTVKLIIRLIKKFTKIKISLPGIGSVSLGSVPGINFGVIFDAIASFLKPIDIPDSWGFNLGQELICVCVPCKDDPKKECCLEGRACIYDENNELRSSHGSGFFKVFWATLRIILQKEPFPNLEWPSFGGGSSIGNSNSNLSKNVNKIDNVYNDKKRNDEMKQKDKELQIKMIEKEKELTVKDINEVLKKIKNNNEEIKIVEAKINKIIFKTGVEIPLNFYDWKIHPLWGLSKKKTDLIKLLKIDTSKYSFKNTKHNFVASNESGNYIDSYKQINIPIYRIDIDDKPYELEIYIANENRISERLDSLFKQRYPYAKENLVLFQQFAISLIVEFQSNSGFINHIATEFKKHIQLCIGHQPEFQHLLNSFDSFIGGKIITNTNIKLKNSFINKIKQKIKGGWGSSIDELVSIASVATNVTTKIAKFWEQHPQLQSNLDEYSKFDNEINYLIKIRDYSYIRIVNPQNQWIFAPGDTWRFNTVNTKYKNKKVQQLQTQQNKIKTDTERLLQIYKNLNQKKSDIESKNDKDAIYAGLLEALMNVEINPLKWIASLFNVIINSVNKLLQIGVINPIKSIIQLIIRLITKIIDSVILQLKKILNLIVMPIKKVSKLVNKIHLNFYKAFQIIFEVGPINMILYYFYNKIKKIMFMFNSFISIISVVIVLVSFLIVCPFIGACVQFFRIYNTTTNLIKSFINDIIIFFAKEYVDEITIYKDKLMTFVTETIQKFIKFIMNITIGNPLENPQQLIYVVIAIVIIIAIIIFGLSMGNYNNNFMNDFISKNTNKMFNNIEKKNKLEKKNDKDKDKDKENN
jgi:hypothetical protein